MLDVRRLRLLVELHARGTLTGVAAALHQSPSSISQQLALLEREAGVQLLRHVGRRVQLTAAAEALVAHATAILDRLEQAEAELNTADDDIAGTLRIAAFQSASSAIMPETLAELARRHPRLRVTMSQRVPEDALPETAAREFDLVIAEEYPGHPAPLVAELDRVALTSDELHLAVPREGAPWSAIRTLSDAAQAPWVMEPPGAASRHWAELRCRAVGFEPDIRFVTDDLQTQIALIESGNAVTILPGLMLSRGAPAVRLVELDGRPRRRVFTSTRTAIARTPAVSACRSALESASLLLGL